MPRAPKMIDLAYEHWLRAVPATPPAPSPAIAARDLAARLHCLKALMDQERGRPVAHVPTLN